MLPGFIGREPWKNADIAAFGYMLELAPGATQLAAPATAGPAAASSTRLLPYWLGAWAIKLPVWMAPGFCGSHPLRACCWR